MNTPYFSYFPTSIKHHHYSPGFRSRPHYIRSSSIGYINRGRGHLIIDHHTYPLNPGTIFIFQPTQHIQLIAPQDSSLELQLLQYRSVKIEADNNTCTELNRNPHLFASHLPVIEISSLSSANTLLQQLQLSLPDATPYGMLKKQFLLVELLLLIHDNQKAQGQFIHESIKKTMTYMEERFTKPLQVRDLPQLAGMTPSSYCRAFKKETNMTPSSFLTHLRIKRAKELMMIPHLKLKDISQSIGFQDELYFSRVFRKLEGVSPTIYVKRYETRVAVVSNYFFQDHLLALGVTPVAAPSFPNYFSTSSGFPSYLQNRLFGTKPLNAERTIPSREVLSLDPDLIIKTNFTKNPNDKLWGKTDNTIFLDGFTGWEEFQREIAVQLKKEGEGEHIIQKVTLVEQWAQKKLEKLTHAGKWTIIRLLPNDCRIYGIGRHAFSDLFYNRLGFQPDDGIVHPYYIEHAFEQLIQLNPENILIIWTNRTELELIYTNPLWQNLSAVRNNQVYYPESKEWDPWGPIGRESMIKQMTNYLLHTIPN